uniref:Nuclear mRNA export factor n=1 Tax=Blastobotrys adeninivorans TaxID=409370 RepID=A0A060SXG0_BLAAD
MFGFGQGQGHQGQSGGSAFQFGSNSAFTNPSSGSAFSNQNSQFQPTSTIQNNGSAFSASGSGFNTAQWGQGSQGNQASQWNQSTQGNQWSQGAQGNQWSQGAQGNQWNQGTQGNVWNQGNQSNQWNQHPQSNQGNRNQANRNHGQPFGGNDRKGKKNRKQNVFQSRPDSALHKDYTPISQATPSGFRNRPKKSRPTPAYLLPEQASNIKVDETPDPWDVQNQQQMLKVEAAASPAEMQSLYEQLQAMRENERKEMENRGLVDRQDVRKNLTDAISFVGSCTDMCPIFERIRRTYENDVKQMEKDPDTGKVTPQRAVKKFSRPAAGQPPPLPSDVRPPSVLVKSLYYLIDHALPMLPTSHSFLWDRTRSIRQDFTYQNYSGPEAVECNELIARIHIVSLHVMAGSEQEYSKQQELEQFNKTLQTLSEFYAEHRKRGLPDSPREPEFRAYQLLSHLRDNEIERQIQQLPKYIYDHPQVQLAIKLRSLIQQNNIEERGVTFNENSLNYFSTFFSLVNSPQTPYLFACLLESSFNEIRLYSLKAMARAYHHRAKPYYVSRLTKMLLFDNEDQTIDFCTYYDLPLKDDEGGQCIEITAFNPRNVFSKAPRSPPYSANVQAKLGSRSLGQVIYKGDDFGANGIAPAPAFTQTGPPKPVFTQPFAKPQSQPPHPSGLFANTLQPPQPQVPKFIQPSPVAQAQQTLAEPKPKEPKPLFTPATAAHSEKTQPTNEESKPFTFGSGAANKEPPKSTQPVQPVQHAPKPVKEPVPVKVPEPPKPVPPPKPKFDEAEIRKETAQLLQQTVSSLVREDAVPNTWQQIDHARKQRKDLIDSVTDKVVGSLLGSFIEPQIKQAFAEKVGDDRIKRNAIHILQKVGAVAKERADEKRRRREEYELVRKQLGKRVYRSASQNSLDRVRRRITPKSSKDEISAIRSARQEAQNVWKTLDVSELLIPGIEQGFKSTRTFDRSAKVVVFCRDWDNVTGQWTRDKLGLQWNGRQDTTYEKVVRNARGTQVSVSALQQDPSTYYTVCGLVFECGLDEDFDYDRAALREVVNRLNEGSRYKSNVILLYWGRRPQHEVLDALQVSQYSENFIFCDTNQGSASNQLSIALQTLAGGFRGELTGRGRREEAAIAHEQQLAAQKRHEELERLRQVKEQEEQDKMVKKMKSRSSLSFFSGTKRPMNDYSEPNPTPAKAKRKIDEGSKSFVPRGISELQELVSSVLHKKTNVPS